eukprot:gene7616-biopygen6070
MHCTAPTAYAPPGHPERDIQPDGYARAAGPAGVPWPSAAGAVHTEVDHPVRNSSTYPVFGLDHDPREKTGWQVAAVLWTCSMALWHHVPASP